MLLISQYSPCAGYFPLIRICLRCFYSETSLPTLTHSVGICVCIVFIFVYINIFLKGICLHWCLNREMREENINVKSNFRKFSCLLEVFTDKCIPLQRLYGFCKSNLGIAFADVNSSERSQCRINSNSLLASLKALVWKGPQKILNSFPRQIHLETTLIILRTFRDHPQGLKWESQRSCQIVDISDNWEHPNFAIFNS